jgi:DNA-damage-inducible protein J
MAEVRAKIDDETKRKAVAVLKPMGVSTAAVVRLVFATIAETGALPFAPPLRPETIEAIKAARRGETKSFGTIEDMFADLHADD